MMMGHGVGILLLTAVAGYWVLERASAHKGQLQKVGFFVGSFVIVASLVGIVCKVWCLGTGKSMMCPLGGKMDKGAYYCPFHSGMPAAPASTK